MKSLEIDPIPIASHDFLSLPHARRGTGSAGQTTVREAAQNFEALFVLELLQEMEKTLEKGSIFGDGLEGKTYADLVRWELAKNISTQSPLGIADALVQQLEPHEAAQSATGENIP